MIIYGRLQVLILPFTIAMGKRKDFFEIYRNFEHAPSKMIASPGLKTLGFSTSLSPKGVYIPLTVQL